MSDSSDRLQQAAQHVALGARRYEPWCLAIFALAAGAYAWEEVVQPLVWSVGSDGHYPMATALGHVLGNLETSTATIPLLWGLWELAWFVRVLARDGLWTPVASGTLVRLGTAMILATVFAVVLVPAMSGLADARDAKPWPFDPLHIALAGIGVMVVLIARILRIAQSIAAGLKQENDQFV